MTMESQNETYCSVNSALLGEPLYGTAVHVGVWFLLEYRQPWAAKTTSDNSLPVAVQDWLENQIALVTAQGANGRLQFIKQGRKEDELAFFVAVMNGAEPAIYRFSLTSYEDLFDLDVAAMVAGNARYASNRYHDSLYFVCTHGKRDMCCAKFGMAFYNQLAARVGEQAWQASHLGGHRFAVTVLTLPDGVNYGRLQPTDIPDLIAAQADNTILLERLRGQTRYSPLIQSADYFLRQRTGLRGNDSFAFCEAVEGENGRWQICFSDQDNKAHHVELVQDKDPLQFLASCGKPKMKTVYPYRVA